MREADNGSRVLNIVRPFFDRPVEAEAAVFLRELGEMNRGRLTLLLPVLIFFFGINLVVDLFLFREDGLSFFLYLDSIFVAASFVFLLYLLTAVKDRVDRLPLVLYEAFLMIWAAVLSALQSSMVTLFIFAFASAVVLYIEALYAVLVYCLCFAAFFITARLSGNWVDFSSVEKIELIAILFWSVITSRVLLLAKLREFRFRNRLENMTVLQEEIIRRRTNDLEERLTEREVLIKEIHHRVKNNLQIIVSLANLSLDYMNSESPEAIMLQHRDRVLSMALAHESMYKSGSLASVSLKTYLTDVAYGLVASAEGDEIELPQLDAEDLSVDLDTAIQIGLVITEVFSAFIHSQDRREDPCTLHLEVRKFGDEIVFTLRSSETKAADGALPADSLAMLLIHSITDQLGGRYSFEDDGFRLRVPMVN